MMTLTIIFNFDIRIWTDDARRSHLLRCDQFILIHEISSLEYILQNAIKMVNRT